MEERGNQNMARHCRMLVAKKWNSIVAASEAKKQCRSEEAMQLSVSDSHAWKSSVTI